MAMLSLSNSMHSLAKQEAPLAASRDGRQRQARTCNCRLSTANLAFAAALSLGTLSAERAQPRRRRLQTVHVRAGEETDIFQRFETLTATKQLAERSGDQDIASKIEARLKQEEEDNPVAALAWRQQQRLQIACDTVLLGVKDPLVKRLEAIGVLRDLAAPPLPTSGAEDALFRILREVVGAESAALRQATEEALWDVWHQTDDEEAADKMDKGRTLMEGDRLQEALTLYTELVQESPTFAEAWNKRATIYYMLNEFEKAVEDCKKVLELNPRHFGCLSGLGMCYKGLKDVSASVDWYKQALAVHPNLSGPRAALDQIQRETYVEEYLSPRVKTALASLTGDEFWPAENPEGIALEWDVHRIRLDPPRSNNTYFFRASVRNKALGTHQVRSLARFYALHFACGKTVPLTRPTYGQSEFVLEPGEAYKYSWVFTTDSELVGMVGGMLLERLDRVDANEDDRFLFASLGKLSFSDVPVVPMHKVEYLNQDHIYMGELTLKASRDP